MLAAEISLKTCRQVGKGFRLQWGRGVLAAEIIVFDMGKDGPVVASMGPRRVSRGDSTIVRLPSTMRRPASMGPRRVSRGDLALSLLALQISRPLQWGRGV